jgi:uridylate kinase
MARARRRVILKVSGEAFAGRAGEPVSAESAAWIAREIAAALDFGAEIGVVVGGGNIVRGAAAERSGADRVSADSMGMVATILNGLALEQAMRALGRSALVMSAIPCGSFVERFDPRSAEAHLAAGRVVIFVAGTGNPFFSTDTAAALRAAELGAASLLKATQVDGVYDSDPVENPHATRFSSLTYTEVIERQLRVMDLTAVALAREENLPIIVFALAVPGNIAKAVKGETIGTIVKGV